MRVGTQSPHGISMEGGSSNVQQIRPRVEITSNPSLDEIEVKAQVKIIRMFGRT